MKLVHCDGRTLEVRDLGPVIFRLTAGHIPIKVNGHRIMDDGEARDLLRDLLSSGIYDGGRV